MSGRQKLATFGAVLMAALMVTSMFAGSAAAANIDTANTTVSPDNIPVGADGSVDQNIVNGGIELSNVANGGSDSGNVRVRIDVSNLADQGVDLGQAGVSASATGFSVSSSSVSIANEEIRITASNDDVSNGDTIDSITLTGLDTSNAQVGTDLRYIVEVASADASSDLPSFGDFPGASDDDFASDRFSLSEINNLDQGTQHASIQDAVFNANPGDTIEVGPGTYREQVEISENHDGETLTNLELTSAEGPDQTSIVYSGDNAEEAVSVQADGVTVPQADAPGTSPRSGDRGNRIEKSMFSAPPRSVGLLREPSSSNSITPSDSSSVRLRWTSR